MTNEKQDEKQVGDFIKKIVRCKLNSGAKRVVVTKFELNKPVSEKIYRNKKKIKN
jgi:hypothetical protein